MPEPPCALRTAEADAAWPERFTGPRPRLIVTSAWVPEGTAATGGRSPALGAPTLHHEGRALDIGIDYAGSTHHEQPGYAGPSVLDIMRTLRGARAHLSIAGAQTNHRSVLPHHAVFQAGSCPFRQKAPLLTMSATTLPTASTFPYFRLPARQSRCTLSRPGIACVGPSVIACCQPRACFLLSCLDIS